MGLATGLLAGASAIGSAIGGRAQSHANQQAINTQNQHNQYIDQIGAAMMNANQTPNVWQQQLMSGVNNGNFAPQDLMSTAPQYNAAQGTASLANPASYAAQGYDPSMGQAAGYKAASSNLADFAKSFFPGLDDKGNPMVAKAEAGTSSVGGFSSRDIAAALAGDPSKIAQQQIDLPGLSQLIGQNSGNDALMQLLRSNPMTQRSAADERMLGVLNSGNPFESSDLFKNMQAVNETNYNRALGSIQNSNSLGARFGSAGMQKVAQGSQELTNQNNLANAQIAMSAHEAAAQRQMAAAQLLNQQENARRQDYIQAAVGSGDMAKAQAALLLSGSQSNQQNNLQAQQLNQAAGLQTSLANQDALNRISLANQGAYNAAGMQTQQLGAQVGMANASNITNANLANANASNALRQQELGILAGLQGQNVDAFNAAGAFGAGAMNSMSQFNAGAQNQASQFGADAFNAAGLNNAQFAQQAGLANQSALNNMSQFNTGAQNTASQFNINSLFQNQQQNNAAQQFQTQSWLNAMGLGNQMQNQQQGLNAQILATMAGLQSPGPNTAAGWFGNSISDAAGLGMFAGMMGRRPTPAPTTAAAPTAASGFQQFNPFSIPGYSFNYPLNFGNGTPAGMTGGGNPFGIFGGGMIP